MRNAPTRLLAWAMFSALLLVPLARAAADGLTEDGRVGVVVDRQGLVFVRAAGRQRWTPLATRGLVFPGDRIRTETRGPNALDLRLRGEGRLTVGPGALLDVVSATEFQLLEGEIEVVGTEAAPISVRFGGGKGYEIKETKWLRHRAGRVEVLKESPRWLTGYRAGTSEEWMGSLVVTLDGKEVPLHVGWHKVDVEIRDQVARTTIEQTFVNETDARLEGVFRFPLPADASISGFGMWIGGELVEADVIERERARQIYEDILRRKKDPGLLEWAGGNVFQARVFPIEPHSEKRVRLRYTEVLPLEQGVWRYRYALRSELLRQKPLKELQVTVRALSTQTLESVTCPTHPTATVSADAHTAQVELSQRDVSPQSDFEVAGKVAGGGLTVVTHRRGADGWFMLLVRPPEPEGQGWQRDLVPDSGPLDLVLAVDTSGSIDDGARKAQSTFLTALLGLLSPEDKVRVCTLDTRLHWLAPQALAADAALTDKVLGFLGARVPRGWSDLDGAFEQLLAAAGERTNVIYVGDGIATSGDGDPVALAQRIRAAASRTKAAFHAVAPAATYEKVVLEALASLGGGSVRHLREDPAGVAQRMLSEMAQPGMKDVKVEIQGVPTARVYPERLPNLAAGNQHIVLGRMQPAGVTPEASVVVSGTLDGKPVRYSGAFALPTADEGNSFLPRLWARRHLDALLEQGNSKEIKEEIVRFSTEHTILTPYTSLLVLESDEDRERYGVERRVKARDGEIEFASTRDTVALQASKRAIEGAQAWRLHLRRVMQQEIARLGRDLPIPVPEVALGEWLLRPGDGGEPGLLTSSGFDLGVEWRGLGAAGGSWAAEGLGLALREEGKSLGAPRPMPTPSAAAAPMSPALAPGSKADAGFERLAESEDADDRQDDHNESADEDVGDEESDSDGASDKKLKDSELRRRSGGGGGGGYFRGPGQGNFAGESGAEASGFELPWQELAEGTRRGRSDASSLGFPGAGAPAYDRPPEPEPPLTQGAALELLRLLLARGDEAARLRIAVRTEAFHASRGTTEGAWAQRILRSPEDWFARTESETGPATERSLRGEVLTRLDTGTRLARAWQAGPAAQLTLDDLRRSLGLPSARDLEGAVVRGGDEEREAGIRMLAVTRPPAREVTWWTVQAKDGALLERTQSFPGRRHGKRVYAGHVSVAGVLWPTVIEDFDADSRRVQHIEISIEALETAAYATAFEQAHAGREDVIVLGPNRPTLREARAALAKGTAGLEERIVLTLDRLAASRADEAWTHFEAAVAPHAAKPGAAWLRAAMLGATRRQEPLKQHLLEVLVPAVEARAEGRWGLAERVVGWAGAALGPNEVLALHERLSAAATDGGKRDRAQWAWRWQRVSLLGQLGRVVEARALIAALAKERPHDLGAQTQQAQALQQAGEPQAAIEHLSRALAAGPWLDQERDTLETQRADLRMERQQFAELLTDMEAWAKARPESQEAWVRRVTLLYVLGRGPEADAWLRATLSSVARGEASTLAERAQLGAAIQVAQGSGWNFWSQEFAPVFAEDLAVAARFHLGRDDDRRAQGAQIVQDWRFGQRAATQTLKEDLRRQAAEPTQLATLSFEALQTLLGLGAWNKDAAAEPLYAAVVTGLEARRAAAETFGEREAWAQLLAGIAGQRGDEARVLGVRRLEREGASGRARIQATGTLLGALLEAKHTPALEEETYSLITELAGTAEPEARRLGRAGTHLRQLVAWALPARAEALLGTPEERAKRTRVETREAERQSRRTARTALAQRLEQAAWPEVAAPWAALERLALLSENRENLEQVVAGALALLDPAPGRFAALPREHPLAEVGRVLEARAALLLTHAATRRGAPEALATQALAAFEARWELERHDWRYETFRLLVALDRVPDLTRVLAAWAGPDDVQARWKRAQGYLAAELGKPADAAQAFEALAAVEGALSATDYETLSTWWLVAGDLPRREAAVRARFEAMGEWDLRNWIQGQNRRAGSGGASGGVPGDLPPEIYVALPALLRKAAYPQNHLWVVGNLYNETKDHRTLAALTEGVTGHSADSVYGYLQQAGAQIDGVHEEAALDALRSAALAAQASAQSPLDKRGLALLLARIEARAATVLLKDPSHAKRALEALEAAATKPVEGEIRPLAGYLGSLTATIDTALSAERLRQLGELARGADLASGDRLFVTRILATVHWNEKRADQALDVLEAAYAEGRGESDPRARAELAPMLEMRVAWSAERGYFPKAEGLLEQARMAAASTVEREQLTARLAALWAQGLGKGGSFRIGRGEPLFREAQRLIEQAWQGTPTLGDSLHASHVALSEAARVSRALADVGGDRVRFAKERLPGLLRGFPSEVTQHVEVEANALDKQAGPRASLTFTLDRMDVEPDWYARLDQDVWTQSEWQLAERRTRAEPLGAVGPRLLKRVTAALSGRVGSENNRVSAFWSQGNQHLWTAVVPEMMAAALAAAEQQPAAPGVQLSCAHHLAAMGRPSEAIGVLQASDARGQLHEAGRQTLLQMLLNAKRFDPALKLADSLLTTRPESLALHKQRAQALMGLSRPADAEAALRTGLEHAAGAKAPTPALLGDVGVTAESMAMHAAAAVWLRDALTQAEQAGSERGQWMTWRRSLALALAGLDRIDEAVDVAAVLAVGDRNPHRASIGPIDDADMPEGVLLRAKDLVGYAARFEAAVAKSGADVPVVRKALARVFRLRNDLPNAIHHLEALRGVVADDVVVLRALVELYDATGKPDEARGALDALVLFDPGNAAAWEDLGRRLAKAGQAEEAERAFTNAVEMRPLEPDGYRLLARIALEAQQPARAAVHWHNVTRVRPLEPDGRLGEAKAWIQAGDGAKARVLLDEVLGGTWEERFEPVKQAAAQVLQAMK